MKPYCCIACLDELPDSLSDTGIMLAAGFEEDREPDPAELDFMVCCIVLATDEDAAHQRIREALSASGMGGARSLRTLTTDVRGLVRPQRRAVLTMEPSDVIVRSSFIAYKADDPGAEAQSERIIRGAMLRRRWQFWR